ncbi:MAG: hypothetical protein Q3980_02505 [Turicibacter sp.]|nr:hypothetical protein [Turicibacter sp.]
MKTWTMKLEKLGPKQNQTVLIYGLPRRESKKQLTEVFRAYLSQNRVVGDKFEAWKLYDTSCSFRYTKNLGEQTLQFEVCS